MSTKKAAPRRERPLLSAVACALVLDQPPRRFLREANSPARPAPRIAMEAGSGTGVTWLPVLPPLVRMIRFWPPDWLTSSILSVVEPQGELGEQ